MHMTRADLVLGREWLHGLDPLLKCSYQHNIPTFDSHGAHVLLMGEQDVLTSPMICNAELHAIININEINSLNLCYLMPLFLDSTVYVSEVSNVQSFYAASSCTSIVKIAPTKQHCVSDKDNEQLQSLLDKFCDVFLNYLPFGLPLERAITYGIDLNKPILLQC